MSDYLFLYVPFSSEEEAKKIAKVLISNKLIACANIVPTIKSIYMWENELQEDVETVAWLKTKQDKKEEVATIINKLHSYDTPCIAEVEIQQFNESYRIWIDQQLR